MPDTSVLLDTRYTPIICQLINVLWIPCIDCLYKYSMLVKCLKKLVKLTHWSNGYLFFEFFQKLFNVTLVGLN